MDHEKESLLQVFSSINRFSSSSSNPHPYPYDVFLSFRGQDTRNNFTDHLYTALIESGIHTFRDDDELPRGHDISSELLKAIGESRISIVVFSKTYAASKWCLDELVKIMDCKRRLGQLVLPVFYDVDPCDVRKQTGSFADDFVRHEERFSKEVGEKWRSALFEAANVSGWHLQIVANRSEAKFIKDIVTKVVQMVNQTHLHVAKYPVGLNSRGGILNSLLEIGNGGVLMVGICGMGGIGKTTVAKHVYNSVFSEFECSCFLADVREQCKQPNGLVHLQEQLLSKVLMKGEFKVDNIDVGKSVLKDRFRGKKVLIVLDDLDQIEQFESLAGQDGWFAAGSRIIITTRDMHLLDEAGVERRYDIRELNHGESLMLFSWHAFREPVPLQEYMELSEEIVSFAGGLPLALEVVGSLLVKRNLDFWESTLKKIKEITPNKISKILRLSYDSLGDHTEKDIFLDIACFFIGMDEELAMKIFDACGFYGKVGIENLKDKCLLKNSPDNRLRMHDLIRDIGWEIIREKFPEEPGKHTRLWQKEVICDVLTNDEGTKAVEGIILDLPMQKHFNTRPFAKMPNLRMLQLNNVILDGSFEGLFKKLRWFRWHKCPLKSLPCEFHPSKLVSLDMQISNLNILWQGEKFLGNLKILNLSGSKLLAMIPDFSGARNLVELRFNGCESLSSIHTSIGCLDKLITLDLGECKNLKCLPNSIGHLRSLEELNFCGSHLEELPEQFGNLKSLKILNAAYSWIKQLPHSIGNLSQLHQLVLDGCENLRSLPSSICNLRSLQRLRLKDCSNLKGIPESLGDMKGLRGISASGSGITQLPDSIANLAQLSALYLQNCSNLEKLPEHLGNIESLRELYAEGTAIKQLPDSIGLLHNLKHLSLRNCKQLESLPSSIWDLLVLEQLCLSGCSNLTALNLDACESLHSVLEFPPKLQSPYAADDFTSLNKFPNLFNLHMKNCGRLVKIQGLGNLKSFKEIDLRGCGCLSTTTFESFFSQKYSRRPGNFYKIYIPRRVIPDWFEYQEMGGSSISIDVPFCVQPDFMQLTLWVNYLFRDDLGYLQIRIINKTSGTVWASYIHGRSSEGGSCVIHGMLEYRFKSGDRIVVSFEPSNVKVEMYGIHLAHTKKGSSLLPSSHRIEDRVNLKRWRDYRPMETSSNVIKLPKRLNLGFQ